MSIRSNALGHYSDLSPELQQILRRNGMQAHIIPNGNAYQLALQGHDSPLLTYDLTHSQLHALTDGGTNYTNKNAYNTFVSIVGNDFYIPKDFVHARNANGRVAMGLHGYRIGTGEYGRPIDMHRSRVNIHPDLWTLRGILGWSPRQQAGFHVRRVGGAMFMGEAPMVAERPDRRMKPGELQSGGYGFYYKGKDQSSIKNGNIDVLKELEVKAPVLQQRQRSSVEALPYSQAIGSDVYFTKDKWQDVLSSHGIVIDENAKTLTIQSSSINKDFIYDLTEEEIKELTSNSLAEATLETRLNTINDIIKNDYKDKVTIETLNSKDFISIELTPETKKELTRMDQDLMVQNKNEFFIGDGYRTEIEDILLNRHKEESEGIAHVNGQILSELDESKGWFREGRHGREVRVDEIKVEPIPEIEKGGKSENKYKMTAVINGESISHEITQKQYDKFMSIDDYHRMKLFSNIFKEVDMKNLPKEHNGLSIGAGILAALTVAGEMAHGFMHQRTPELYLERHGQGHVFYKPGVDSPQEIASRAFEAGINAAETGIGLGR